MLQDLVEEALSETSPTPDETMLSLCTKIESSQSIMDWIKRMGVSNQTKDVQKPSDSFIVDSYIDEIKISKKGIFISCEIAEDIRIAWDDERISGLIPR